jgi:SAM-dependent methyltransferase
MGTAEVQGPLWGSRAREWATIQEQTLRAGYEAVLADIKPGPGSSLLDIGCGAGMFCRMAAAKGATIAGLDAAAELVAITRERVPGGDIRQGEMQSLPWGDATFDVVTGFNVFHYATDPRVALGEARRVTKPGGHIVVMVWGQPSQCDATAYLRAVEALLPPQPQGGPERFSLSAPGQLEALMSAAGLHPGPGHEVITEWRYPDEATAIRGLSSAGPAIRATQHAGAEAVTHAIAQALAPYRQRQGHYLLRNTYRYVIAAV